MTVAHVNAVATAVPDNDIHAAYLDVVAARLGRREALLFRRMASRSGIEHRYSFFRPAEATGEAADSDGFFRHGDYPGTAARMARFERDAPVLAAKAIAGLDLDPQSVTHLVAASCTGFMAPGLDQRIVEQAGLRPEIERTVVGFMGCYAAVNSLRLAHHIVRSEPEARVLVVNLELCSLHFQDTDDLERNLSGMLFGDGAAAALVTADASGAALHDFRAAALPGSGDLITWKIGDHGFDMHLSGEVPKRIEAAMRAEAARNDDGGILRGDRPADYDLWAVHAGGRTILDAVEAGLELGREALGVSRRVLHDFGNMSSATLMFVMQRILAGEGGDGRRGIGLAFGPGLAAESFRFTRV
jgi:predicted naringenin-chalcone synthase